MALVKAVTRPSGIDTPAAYHRVTATILYQDDGVGTIVVKTWKDKAARDDGKAPLAGEAREFIVSTGRPAVKAVAAVKDEKGKVVTPAVAAVAEIPNFEETFGDDAPPIEAAYGFLKTLDEFIGAVDA